VEPFIRISPALPLFEIDQREYGDKDNMVPQPYALEHSLWCVFPHLDSIEIPFSSYSLKAKYVELMGKDKGYKSSHAYYQVKGWSKKSYETFSKIFWKGF
jgi:hypothetical protein